MQKEKNKNITTWKWDADQFSISPKTMHSSSSLLDLHCSPTPPDLLSFPIKVVVVRRYWKQLNAQISCPLFSSMCERRKRRKRRRSSSSRGRRSSRRTEEREGNKSSGNTKHTENFLQLPGPKTQAGIQMRSKCRGSTGRDGGCCRAAGGVPHALCALFDNWQKQLLCALLLLCCLLPKKLCVYFLCEKAIDIVFAWLPTSLPRSPFTHLYLSLSLCLASQINHVRIQHKGRGISLLCYV